jgi:cytoskeleton protein RodZ
MSETNKPANENTSAVLERPSVDSAGAMLRAARENAGLHVAALAVAIKIPVKKLEALESDQLLGTHDLVFTRALASSVCRTLKIDPATVLAALPQTAIPELHVDSNGINAPFTPRGTGQSRPMNEVITQPWVMLVFALCVGAAVMAATDLWGHKSSVDLTVVSTPTAEEVVVPPLMSPVVIPAPAGTETSPDDKTVAIGASLSQATAPTLVNAGSVVTMSTSSGGAGDVAAAVTPVGTASAVLNVVGTKSVSAGASGAPISDPVLSFKARQQSVWVKVTDAKGEVRLSRTISAGERIECGGVLPLSVILGRADAVDVEIRGKPFDFSAFSRENVARFEVK